MIFFYQLKHLADFHCSIWPKYIKVFGAFLLKHLAIKTIIKHLNQVNNNYNIL